MKRLGRMKLSVLLSNCLNIIRYAPRLTEQDTHEAYSGRVHSFKLKGDSYVVVQI